MLDKERANRVREAEKALYHSKKKLLKHVCIDDIQDDLKDWSIFGRQTMEFARLLDREKTLVKMDIQEMMLKIEAKREVRWKKYRMQLKDMMKQGAFEIDPFKEDQDISIFTTHTIDEEDAAMLNYITPCDLKQFRKKVTDLMENADGVEDDTAEDKQPKRKNK